MLSDGTYNTSAEVGTPIEDANLGSMFVWIPRYEYYILDGPTTQENVTTYSYSSSTFDNTYKYSTTLGVLASSTGNTTGIYDLSGGVYEYTAAINSSDTYNDTTQYGSSMATETDARTVSTSYCTVYKNTRTNYGPSVARCKKGDATCEVYVGTFSGYNEHGLAITLTVCLRAIRFSYVVVTTALGRMLVYSFLTTAVAVVTSMAGSALG